MRRCAVLITILVGRLGTAADTPKATLALQATGLAKMSVSPHRAPGVRPPPTPAGGKVCDRPLSTNNDLPRYAGEAVRYLVNVNGLSVGTIDFKIEKNGTFNGQAVTEYRSLFRLDALVSTVVAVDGRALSLVPANVTGPAQAVSSYRFNDIQFEESASFAPGNKKVSSSRSKNGQKKDEQREFPMSVVDFVSGFYLVRALPETMNGCAVLYGNQRAYTIWVEPNGQEEVKTPVGLKPAQRYKISYTHEKAKRWEQGTFWLSTTPERLPYKAEVNGQNHLEAFVHMYEKGRN